MEQCVKSKLRIFISPLNAGDQTQGIAWTKHMFYCW
jgi:hypothetical protein